jgi:hypothetical protein
VSVDGGGFGGGLLESVFYLVVIRIMNSSRIISIVSRLPPSIDGVGDYALSTARALRQQFGIETEFVVCDPLWRGDRDLEGFSIHTLPNRNADSLSNLLRKLTTGSSIVLLHMSGYGYAKWALCNWLVEGLRQWKGSNSKSQLVTMFHELYNCMGWPWQHNFWVSYPQKRIAENLARLSDRCITSCEKYALELTGLSNGKHQDVQFLPVVSTVGEPESVRLLVDRSPQLVVFGLGGRASAYQKFLPMVEEVCLQLGIQRVVDIGTPTGLDFTRLTKITIVEMGRLSAADVGKILGESMFGWLSYDVDRLEKSSVYSAYAAHGLVPIIHAVNKSSQGKSYSRPFLSPSSFLTDPLLPSSDASLQAIASHAWSLYQDNRQSMAIKIFAKVLGTSSSEVTFCYSGQSVNYSLEKL